MTGLSHEDVVRLLAAIDVGDSPASEWRVEVEACAAPRVLVRSPSAGRLCWDGENEKTSEVLGAVLVGSLRRPIQAPTACRRWTRLAAAGDFVEFGQVVAVSAAAAPFRPDDRPVPRPRAPSP